MRMFHRSLLCLLISLQVCHCGLFSWLFKSYQTQPQNIQEPPDKIPDYGRDPRDSSALVANVPFEMTTADEKFISEVTSLTSIELSELDKCHHRVILSLTSTCSDMSEEELAKVAVNLLNCQSAVEGRSIYPCTTEMNIQECTKLMDLSTWNAYHIVSNRARAVCYQFRQQQFKAKTELTINKLMMSAKDQIDAMKQLEATQTDLQETTLQTFQNLNSGHQMLLEQQEELSVSQRSIHSYVASNLRDLYKEKKLIALGQKELGQVTESIKRKLVEAQKQLQQQGLSQQGSHEKILLDLASIQESAEKVGQQLDDSTAKILKTHEQTIQFYQHLMHDLQQMNSTVYHLMTLLRVMRTKFEERFSWISALLGDTDETLQRIYSFTLFVCYFFISMVGAGFLKVPYPTRVFLVVLVPLNAISELKYASSLPFSTLTVALVLFLCLDISSKHGMRLYRRRRCKARKAVESGGPAEEKKASADESKAKSRFLRSIELRRTSDDLRKDIGRYSSVASILSPRYDVRGDDNDPTLRERLDSRNAKSDKNVFEDEPRYLSSDEAIASVRRRLLTKLNKTPLETESANEVPPSSTPLTTPNSKSAKKCSAICKNGLQCRNTSTTASPLCFRHLNVSREGTPTH